MAEINNVAIHLEALLLRAVAPPHLADAVIGDLCERRAALAQTLGEARALAVYRAEALRSIPSLAAHRALQSLADNSTIALPVAAIICALCVALIPFWSHFGMEGGVYHILRLFAIGLVLGRMLRASSLSFVFLLLLIGISDAAIDARQFDVGWQVLTDSELYRTLLIDGVAMAAGLTAVRLSASSRRNPNST